MYRFVEALGQRLTEVEAHLEDRAFKSLPARLASLLLELAAKAGSSKPVDGYTHQDLAEMLGTYRETITQTLNEFRQEGLVEIGRKHILILDQVALEAIAET